MLKRFFIFGLIGLFLLIMAGCIGDFTGGSGNLIESTEAEMDQLADDQDQEDVGDNADEFIEGGPPAIEQDIYREAYDRIYSSENPGRRNTPNDFISRDRDPAVYEAWVNESYDLGIAFRDRVFSEAGAKYGKTAEEISVIYSKVSSWRVENSLTEEH